MSVRTCPVCGEQFKSLPVYRWHMWKRHGKG
jgi:hypothetical protein